MLQSSAPLNQASAKSAPIPQSALSASKQEKAANSSTAASSFKKFDMSRFVTDCV